MNQLAGRPDQFHFFNFYRLVMFLHSGIRLVQRGLQFPGELLPLVGRHFVEFMEFLTSPSHTLAECDPIDCLCLCYLFQFGTKSGQGLRMT